MIPEEAQFKTVDRLNGETVYFMLAGDIVKYYHKFCWRESIRSKEWLLANAEPIWPESESRIDIIGINGNSGLHYN